MPNGSTSGECAGSKMQLQWIPWTRRRSKRLRIRVAVENWAPWRDAGDWERFRTVWHPEGRMMATWFQGSAEAVIAASREGYAQTRIGFTVKRDMPQSRGAEVERLYRDGAAWLAGKPLPR